MNYVLLTLQDKGPPLPPQWRFHEHLGYVVGVARPALLVAILAQLTADQKQQIYL